MKLRALSDTQLAALVESLPEGLGILDETAVPLWMNRQARHLLRLRATTSPADALGTPLGLLIPCLVDAMPSHVPEQHARWIVEDGGVVELVLRRMIWGSQIAVWLRGSTGLAALPAESRDDEGPSELSPLQLIVAERLLDEAAVGVAVASAGGQIRWLNQQAERLLGCGQRLAANAEQSLARAARHVASGRLVAPVRLYLQLTTRALDATFWNMDPRLAGVLLQEADAVAASSRAGGRAFTRDQVA